MKIETFYTILCDLEKENISPKGKEKLKILKEYCDKNLEIHTPINYPIISDAEYDFLCNVNRESYNIIKRYGYKVFLSNKELVSITVDLTKLLGEQWFQCLEMNQEYEVKVLLEVYENFSS